MHLYVSPWQGAPGAPKLPQFFSATDFGAHSIQGIPSYAFTLFEFGGKCLSAVIEDLYLFIFLFFWRSLHFSRICTLLNNIV